MAGLAAYLNWLLPVWIIMISLATQLVLTNRIFVEDAKIKHPIWLCIILSVLSLGMLARVLLVLRPSLRAKSQPKSDSSLLKLEFLLYICLSDIAVWVLS